MMACKPPLIGRQCSHLKLGGELGCVERIKKLQLPGDPIDNPKFCYPSALSDMDDDVYYELLSGNVFHVFL